MEPEPEAPKARLTCVQCGYAADVSPRKDLTVGKMIPGLCPDCKGNMVVTMDGEGTKYPIPVDGVLSIVRRHFPVNSVQDGFNHLRLEVGKPYESKSFTQTIGELEALGFLPIVRHYGEKDIMTIFPKVEERGARVRTNIILLGLTILSTFFAGLYLTGFFFGSAYFGVAKWDAVLYSVGIMSILGLHEMGHKLASMYYRVEATYPYFIPVPWPFILGTMGAIIKMKGSLPDRNAMLRIGAAGPICGFLVAIPVTMIGLALSTPEVALQRGGTSIVIGASPLFSWLRGLVVPSAYGLSLHPLAVAGWAGMLVTMLNLFPAGMLDGGHVSRAVFGMRIHRILGYLTGFVLLGLFFSQQARGASFAGWLLWGIMALFFSRVGHPGSLDESTRLSKASVGLGLAVLVVFALTAVPLPIRLVDQPKVYVSTFDSQPVAITPANQSYIVRARLANQARLNDVEDVEARILLPAGATLFGGSEAIVEIESIDGTADAIWNVTAPRGLDDLRIFCLVEAGDGGSDQAALSLT